jgi:hypothetical protein
MRVLSERYNLRKTLVQVRGGALAILIEPIAPEGRASIAALARVHQALPPIRCVPPFIWRSRSKLVIGYVPGLPLGADEFQLETVTGCSTVERVIDEMRAVHTATATSTTSRRAQSLREIEIRVWRRLATSLNPSARHLMETIADSCHAQAARPGSVEALCHLDLNPGNVLVDDRRQLSFIDWAHSRRTLPEIDMATLFAYLALAAPPDASTDVARWDAALSTAGLEPPDLLLGLGRVAFLTAARDLDDLAKSAGPGPAAARATEQRIEDLVSSLPC